VGSLRIGNGFGGFNDIGGSITSYVNVANGNSAPIAKTSGANTLLTDGVSSVALDSAANIYATQSAVSEMKPANSQHIAELIPTVESSSEKGPSQTLQCLDEYSSGSCVRHLIRKSGIYSFLGSPCKLGQISLHCLCPLFKSFYHGTSNIRIIVMRPSKRR
jgi:hypothetical protein